MGTEGLYHCALLNIKNAHYLEGQLLKTGIFEKIYQYPYFNEFLIYYRGNIDNLNQNLLEHKFIPPLWIQPFYPDKEFKNALLFAVTEVFTKDELDHIVSILSK
jgi:glycine dehydrogenase subunit 1